MLTTQAIAEAMTGQDATNGWDAAYGMNLKQVNALFLQQYLMNGPAHTTTRLRVVLQLQTNYWILEADLGPPRLTFHKESQIAQLEMELVRGALIAADLDAEEPVIQSAGWLRPVESRLTGPLVLAKTTGEVNELGKVVADLGASAYTPSITGVDPGSVLQTDIGLAVQTYFAANKSSYPLGAIVTGNVPDCLRPTSFHFWVQAKPGSDDACVVLLIRTNGKDGTLGPLATHPIADGHTATLLIAKNVLGRLLVDTLTDAFRSANWRFEYQPNGNTWKVVSVGGDLDFGPYGQEGEKDGAFWSCDDHTRLQNVRVPVSGFTVEPTQGALSASWAPHNKQHWALHRVWNNIYGEEQSLTYLLHSTISPSFKQSAAPQVCPEKAEVTFPGVPDSKLNADGEPNFWEHIFDRRTEVPDAILAKLKDALEPPFHKFRLPNINAFALTNLLFPAQHAVSLKEAALPGDLCLMGSLVQPISVEPVDAVATPGRTVQFKASSPTDKAFLWSISPNVGTIRDGLYTAPTTLKKATMVVISAISKTDANRKGSAMALLYNPPGATGVAVSPDRGCVTAHQLLQLTTTDAGGHFVEVDWKLEPNVGHMKAGFPHGKYSYIAPSTINKPMEVRATATNKNDSSKVGVATILLLPTVKVAVSPKNAKVKFGATIELSATAAGIDPQTIRWTIFPASAGYIVAQDDPTKATYHAPPSAESNDVRIVAYAVDDDTGSGLGATDVTLIK